MTRLEFALGDHGCPIDVHTAIVAGWTGRDRQAVEEHIAELEELGVSRPSSVPVFYRVSASRLTTATEIEATAASSGEVEPVIMQSGGELLVGVGSDHTDREVESYSVAVSKQLCDKPVAPELWRYDEVVEHWDRLTMRAWIVENRTEVLYQEGTLAALLQPRVLLKRAAPAVTDGAAMFCGTLPARGGIRSASSFRYQLEDPVLGRTIEARYEIRTLPLIS